MRPIRSAEGDVEAEGEGLVESLPKPNALRRAARPGEGLRGARGFCGSWRCDAGFRSGTRSGRGRSLGSSEFGVYSERGRGLKSVVECERDRR
jgi:hypothetical protein